MVRAAQRGMRARAVADIRPCQKPGGAKGEEMKSAGIFILLAMLGAWLLFAAVAYTVKLLFF